MKKSVIFLIGVIYVLSIVVVSFFGMQPAVDQFKVYMTDIEITNYTTIANGEKYITLDYNEIEGITRVDLEYSYSPDNASYPNSVKYTITGNTYKDSKGDVVTFATVSSTGSVEFLEPGIVTVTITATDGSKVSDSVKIICA